MGELCTRLLASAELPSSGGQKPHVTLVVDLPTLQAHTGEGLGVRSQVAGYFDTTLGPEAARRLSCDSAATTVVTTQVGVPLAVGRAARTVTAGQHRYLRVRDNGCVFPGCDRPHDFTDAHHVQHWSAGGPTDVDNLVMLCRRHHRFVHSGQSHGDIIRSDNASRGVWRIERIPHTKDFFQWWPPGQTQSIPAQHQPLRNPLTRFDWAIEMSKLRTMWRSREAVRSSHDVRR